MFLGPTLATPPAKRLNKEAVSINRLTTDQYAAMVAAGIPSGMPRHITQINGKPKITHMTRTGSGRKQVVGLMDAPDDVYFKATETGKYVVCLN